MGSLGGTMKMRKRRKYLQRAPDSQRTGSLTNATRFRRLATLARFHNTVMSCESECW